VASLRPPIIPDANLALRPWRAADAKFLIDASADPAIQRYSLSRCQPFSLAEAEKELRNCETLWFTTDAAGRPAGSLVIADATSDEAFGQCGIDGWSPSGAAQIGYWLAPEARGRGIATRAVIHLTNWLFELGATGVYLTVLEDNHPSISLARRAGFLPAGPTGEGKVWNGVRREVLEFGVTAEEWQR